MTFNDFVGHEDAKLALILNAIDFKCGGVLFVGEKGSGKTTLARLLKNLLPEKVPFIEVPLNLTEEALIGGIDLERTIKLGKKVIQEGILSRANGGVIYIDDINLLPSDLLALILEVEERGENIIEREGLALRHPARFILVGSMNPEEGTLSPHFLDRFGMCVLWEGLKDPSLRVEVMKKAAPELFISSDEEGGDKGLRERIYRAQNLLKTIKITGEVEQYIANKSMENQISGHRGDLFLFYASRAYAALCEAEELIQEHVEKVLPLVFKHRRRFLREMKEQNRNHEEKELKGQEKESKEQGRRQISKDSVKRPLDGRLQDLDNLPASSKESLPKEEIFPIGDIFKTRHFLFRKDRLNRIASGRRTKTRTKGKGGKYVRSLIQPRRNDIAIEATIRAAAPYQKIRGKKNNLIIYDEDLRYRQRERKMGHLVIFVVDGSGSMGVQRRMVETKGAVRSLLLDCYQKRDKVSMIVFRKDRAEVVLPPTSSVELASKKLRQIPVGHKTPLCAGLLEAYKLIKRMRMKSPETRFLLILVTDGRANQTMTDISIGEEIKRVVNLLREMPSTDFIVVDTEKKGFIKTDLALQIASQLRANYYMVENIKSEFLTELVQIKKKELS